MKSLKVYLWGKEIGRLVWDANARRTYFTYNSSANDDIPDVAPLQSPISKIGRMLPVYGDERPMYQGLPPFIADSLPDSWGNTLFEKWVKDNKIPRNKITPLYKLMFIGTRGMGALEYEPVAVDMQHSREIDVKALYDMSLKILQDRVGVTLAPDEELTMQALLAVGTSAGGRQMKAILAINGQTGEIRSGQTDGLDGFDYYILKFGDNTMSVSEIETAYYDMAMCAGVEMEPCRLFTVEGVNHFLTRRYDRKDGEKIHVQTLAAMNPDANSYEDLVATCRELQMSENEIEQLYCRMVFNVMTNNTDDHNKNFSFLLEQNGKWRLAPAYDVTFIFNTSGTAPNKEHRLSIGGKLSGITKSDLLEFACRNDIRNANAIIDRVAEAVGRFDDFAIDNHIAQPWCGIIRKCLADNLVEYGYCESQLDIDEDFLDRFGRKVTEFSIVINGMGYYDISAVIDGKLRRRIIRQNNTEFHELKKVDINRLSSDVKSEIVGRVFSHER